MCLTSEGPAHTLNMKQKGMPLDVDVAPKLFNQIPGVCIGLPSPKVVIVVLDKKDYETASNLVL